MLISKAIVDHRTTIKYNTPKNELILWESLSPDEASWESLPTLREHYPDFHLKDKELFEEWENVMNKPKESLRDVAEEQSEDNISGQQKFRDNSHSASSLGQSKDQLRCKTLDKRQIGINKPNR